MKTHLLAASLLFFFTIGCRKKEGLSTETLHRKWQVYSTKIVRLDDSFNQGACSYRTTVADFYGPPTIPSCQDDDVYDFTNPHHLTIHAGSKKCLTNEPASTTRPYEKRGDSIVVNGLSYYIVHLSTDTMILDYCTDLNTYPPGTIVNRAKVGMKFIARE
jgi:hypothetical protein